MIQEQINVRAWGDRGQAFQEFVGGKDQVARAVMPRVAECADDAAVGEAREPLLRERRTQEVSAESFEPEPVVGADGAIGMEIETLKVGVAGADRPHPRGIGCVADAQHGCAGTVAKRRATADGGGAELREHGGIGGERIGRDVGRVLRGEHATPSEQTPDAGADRREQVRHVAIGRRWRGIEAHGAVRRGRKHALQQARVIVNVELEAAAKTLDRGDCAAPAITDPASAPASALEAEERAGIDREHGATEGVIPRQAIAERMRERAHPLPHRDVRQDVVDEFRGTGCHSPAPATRTKTAPFARKRHARLGVTAVALKARKPPGPNSAVQEAAELLLEKGGESGGIGAGGGGEKGFQVLAHHLMEHGAFRVARRVPQGRNGGRAVVAGGGLSKRGHETAS